MENKAYGNFLSHLTSYFDVVKLMDYRKETKKCLLRHDVDVSLSNALEMAEIEYSMDVESTYFVLHTAPYYGRGNFIDVCKKIQGMGHEIGLHSNVITSTIKEELNDPKTVLDRELSYLRENDLEIHGTSSHGDPLCHQLEYVNYRIFKECPPKRRKGSNIVKGVKLYKLSLKDYGLYEAYFIPYDCYISDPGGVWRTSKNNKLIKYTTEKIKKVIEKLGEDENVKTLQLLTHPCWWRF